MVSQAFSKKQEPPRTAKIAVVEHLERGSAIYSTSLTIQRLSQAEHPVRLGGWRMYDALRLIGAERYCPDMQLANVVDATKASRTNALMVVDISAACTLVFILLVPDLIPMCRVVRIR